MNQSNQTIQSVVDKIKKIGGKRVWFIMQYGSTVTDDQTPISDVDVAIYYNGSKEQRFEFNITILGIICDTFDIQIFQDLPIYIQKEIISKGKILYNQNYFDTFDVFLKTIQNFSDFKPFLDIYYDGLE